MFLRFLLPDKKNRAQPDQKKYEYLPFVLRTSKFLFLQLRPFSKCVSDAQYELSCSEIVRSITLINF